MLKRLLATAAIATLVPLSAHAVTQTLNINLTVVSDNTGNFLGETGTATITYDDADLTTFNSFTADYVAVPTPFFGVLPPDFDFTLSIFGQTFTDVNDSDSILQITTTLPTQWSLSISETDIVSPTAINNPSIFGFSSTNNFLIPDFTAPNTYDLQITVNDAAAAVIPLPATAPLLGAGIIGLGVMMRRRRKAA